MRADADRIRIFWDVNIDTGFWRPRRPGFPFRPVALRPCFSTGLPFSINDVYSTSLVTAKLVIHIAGQFDDSPAT